MTRYFAVGQQCEASNYQYADTKTPLTSTAMVEWRDATPASIITVTHRMHTMAFVGTTQGNLLKVIILQSETVLSFLLQIDWATPLENLHTLNCHKEPVLHCNWRHSSENAHSTSLHTSRCGYELFLHSVHRSWFCDTNLDRSEKCTFSNIERVSTEPT